MIKRYYQKYIVSDLNKKMVFIGGARQCGKTTLAKEIIKDYPYKKDKSGIYFNWDNDDDRFHIRKQEWSENQELIVFDEIHKFPRWKSWIKGIYDTCEKKHRFLVTGSARLDVYRRGGDSLMGRYHYWRLHPFSLTEFPKKMGKHEAFKRLMTVGGFPEPFLDGDEREARRWRKERFDRILKDDILDLEPLRYIQTLSLFVDLLRRRVGILVVLSNLADELQVSYKTVKHWLEILEKMYIVFVVRPFTKKIPRSVLKPPKVYFYDNADVIGDEGAKFENLVATTLLKRINFIEDYEGFKYELCYIRDKEGREVDFALIKERELEELIEVKYSDSDISKSLRYYSEKLKPEKALQIVATIKKPYSSGKLHVVDPFETLMDSPWSR